jgi:2-oxoglutarate ferredoxin oxidoreductase subunit gamma
LSTLLYRQAGYDINSVMVGFVTAVTHLLNADSVRKAVADSVPKSFLDLNLKAFERGLEYGAIAVTAPASSADAELQMEYAPE